MLYMMRSVFCSTKTFIIKQIENKITIKKLKSLNISFSSFYYRIHDKRDLQRRLLKSVFACVCVCVF